MSDQRPMSSEGVSAAIDDLLLSGRAATVAEAEQMFLDAHLDEIAALVEALDDRAFAEHEAVRLLMSHGSRPWEDSAP